MIFIKTKQDKIEEKRNKKKIREALKENWLKRNKYKRRKFKNNFNL